ncbi:MAG: NAD(P)/FAD-dependent oxidoreductase [Paraglaciecola sp.]|nr:NAD(P)/FAD-dependent oxidoreductase [Paraglaciecola sp.]
MKRIVVVGGGAGGLELVAKLSKFAKKRKSLEIILVDKQRTHVWKPLLHEVAAGVIDKNSDGVDYRIHASSHHYEFQQGEMVALDIEARRLTLAQLLDEEGNEILPQRDIEYDNLVMALGSVSNDFRTPGVREYSFFLDSLAQAEQFHKALINQFLRLNYVSETQAPLRVSIVGGGATGTELAAQLHHVANLANAYGMTSLSAKRLQLSIIEAGPRILPALPERIAASAKQALEKIGVQVLENTRVIRAEKTGFVTQDEHLIEADLMVWAAGIKAPDAVLSWGFETNKVQQIMVNQQLQSTVDERIYVLGDCCACLQPDGRWVPPRAQSAHQMANTVYNNILACMTGKSLNAYVYNDYGSLIHLSKYSTVGSLMGNLSNSSMFIEGHMARFVYNSLYSMHQFAVNGYIKGSVGMLSRQVSKFVGSKLKLH